MKRLNRLIFIGLTVFNLAIGAYGGYRWYDRAVLSEANVANLLFDARPPLDLPMLQTLTTDASTDTAALAAIRQYADSHDLAVLFRDPHLQRARALLAMYLVHLAHSYNEDTYQAETLLDFIRRQPWTNCGPNARYQQQISQALGLTTRIGTGFDHVWLEVQIDGKWEVFDSTINVWFSESILALQQGHARQYRTFYTPMADIAYPDARGWLNSSKGYGYYNPISFRQAMIVLGLRWHPASSITYQEAVNAND